jgi:cysteinyl-tRNA synthetase
MTIRFFILSAHYRGTVDFSNEALQAAEKGLEKLLNGIADLDRVQASDKCDAETEKVVKSLRQKCYDAMNDDFATPQVISHLFEACTVVNKLVDHKATICADCLKELSETMRLFTFDILGLSANTAAGGANEAREAAFGKVVDMVLELRAKARAEKDWATCDKIRDELKEAGFEVKDTKDGVTWKLNK